MLGTPTSASMSVLLATRRIAALSLLALIGLVACDSDETVGPSEGEDPVDPPAALALEMPATVVEGQAFTLAVRALDAVGEPVTDWSGRVALVASAGALEPDTVELEEGRAEVEATLTGHAGEVTLMAHVGGVEAGAAVQVLGTAAPARIEITPGALLLPGAGEARPLTARAYDDQDRPVAATVTWRSSDESMVSVSSDGVATAEASLGSAMISAEAGGVVSEPVLALVARPAEDDAVLVADSQVVGTIQPVDPAAAYGTGWRYRVTLRGAGDFEVGRLVIGTGEAVLAGRVVEVTGAGAGAGKEVTLELVPLNALFEELSVAFTLPLEAKAAELSPQAAPSHRLERGQDGVLRVVPRSAGERFRPGPLQHAPGALRSHAEGLGGRLAEEGEDEGTKFSLGPFECTAKSGLPELSMPSPTYSVSQDLALEFAYAGGLGRLAVLGSLEAEAEFRPVFEATFEGEVGCEAELVTLRLPIPGPLGLFFGGQVPLGIGLDLTGSLSLGDVGFEVGAEATGELEVGVACPGGGACSLLQHFEPGADGRFELLYPDGANDLRVELAAYAHALASLKLGSHVSEELQLELVKANAGLRQTVDLATIEGQARDTAYASGYALLLRAEAAPGESLEKALELLDVSADSVTFEYEDTLASSPRGTIHAEPTSIRPREGDTPGDTVTFTVELDPVTYLGLYAVESVSIYWDREMANGERRLERAPGDCGLIPASPGQTRFTCGTDLPAAEEGTQRFYAFVDANLFGAPLPVLHEVNDDAHVDIEVKPAVNLTLSPKSATVRSGGSVQFAASVVGAADSTVTWSATGGAINGDGLYTAGASPGEYTVVATSVADPAASDSATVIIEPEPGKVAILDVYLAYGAGATARQGGANGGSDSDGFDDWTSEPGSLAGGANASAAAGSATSSGSVTHASEVAQPGDDVLLSVTGGGSVNGQTAASAQNDAGATFTGGSDVHVIFEVQDGPVYYELDASGVIAGGAAGSVWLARVIVGPDEPVFTPIEWGEVFHADVRSGTLPPGTYSLDAAVSLWIGSGTNASDSNNRASGQGDYELKFRLLAEPPPEAAVSGHRRGTARGSIVGDLTSKTSARP